MATGKSFFKENNFSFGFPTVKVTIRLKYFAIERSFLKSSRIQKKNPEKNSGWGYELDI